MPQVMKRADVVALYVDPRGPYPDLVEEWYDEARDARTYAGPWPVVAHPPCGPWGAWAHFCTKQDPGAFGVALEAVNRWGGVIEHPANSRAFKAYAIEPTWEVDQCDWGFRARKRTWLYVRPSSLMPAPRPLKKQPTHTLTNRKYSDLPGLSSQARHITPLAFAQWLIELASQANK